MFSLLCLIKHNTHTHNPPPPFPLVWWIVNDEETHNNYKDILRHERNLQRERPQVITNKGQVIIPQVVTSTRNNILSVIDWINQFYSSLFI